MTPILDRKLQIVDWRALLPALLLLGGCFPHSCSRTGSTALFPADSLSRQVARSVPMDTLQRVWRVGASEKVPLRFPRTAMFLPPEGEAAFLAVSDAEREAVLFFSEEGTLTRTLAPESFAVPYLIGRRADTLLVLSPRTRRVDFVAGSTVVRSLTLDLPSLEEAPLLWATASDKALFAKTIDAEGQAVLTRHGARGQVTEKRVLEGPRWHQAGPLRLWNDSLASLSGFRPVVHRFSPHLGPPDTLRLSGFDSPMLARTRRYAEGDARQPPLLMPDAAAADGLLFALNLRAGRLRIDVFGPRGRLRHRLVAPGGARSQDVYPRALAVRRRQEGGYALAVTLTAPEPAVVLYHWRPGGDTGTSLATSPPSD